MKRILLLSVALLWCAMAWATGVKTLKGTVKCDGEGVAAVIVTDGENFTQTDAKVRNISCCSPPAAPLPPFPAVTVWSLSAAVSWSGSWSSCAPSTASP